MGHDVLGTLETSTVKVQVRGRTGEKFNRDVSAKGLYLSIHILGSGKTRRHS